MKRYQKPYKPEEENHYSERETCYGEFDYLEYDCSLGWFSGNPRDTLTKQEALEKKAKMQERKEIGKYISRISIIARNESKPAELRNLSINRQIREARKKGLDLTEQLEELVNKGLLQVN